MKKVKMLRVTNTMLKEEYYFKDWIEAYAMYLFDNKIVVNDEVTVIGISDTGNPIQGYYTELPLPKNEVIDWVIQKLICFTEVTIFVKSTRYLGIMVKKNCVAVITAFLRTYQIDWQFDTSVVNRNINFAEKVVVYHPDFFFK